MSFLFQIFTQFFVRGKCINQNRMVPNIYDLFFHNFFDISKIHHHSIFRVFQIIDGISFHGDKQFVGMSVHIFAFPVIIVKDMRRFESKDFGDSYHAAKIIYLLRSWKK
ncbi:hypothetical protein SDC9_185241 [bioreactor metagenome]|uniref:Uncharacterized protein n=1 Tax=bioreactor metagenome TaxID=1076179 RepID=A0A645HFD9_9ZZZZ